MGQGYQDRDFEIIDYGLYERPDLRRPLRGPDPGNLPHGKHIAFVGAAQTFGCFVPRPFPTVIGEALHVPLLNLGVAGAGPAYFRTRLPYLPLVNRAAFAVVQVMSGRSESNSVFLSQGGEMLRVRGTRRKLGAAPAWNEYLNANPTSAVDALVEETRRIWTANFVALLDQIQVPKVLFWFSEREPEYERTYDGSAGLFGSFPHLVDESWLHELLPHVDRFVSSISNRGMPQRLISRFTGKPVAVTGRADLGGRRRQWNRYYPSPEMHADAATALMPTCRELWENSTGPSPRGSSESRQIQVDESGASA